MGSCVFAWWGPGRSAGSSRPGWRGATAWARRGSHAARARARARRPDESERVVGTLVTAATDAAAELGVQDVVIVAVKAQSMGSVAASIGPLLGPDTSVLSTLNGVPWWFLDGFGGP